MKQRRNARSQWTGFLPQLMGLQRRKCHANAAGKRDCRAPRRIHHRPAGGGIPGLCPVSYTHLDVYKRQTLATITFQNYFRMYKKLAGMTGTALTEEQEFQEIYKLDVVEIPTNKPVIRVDHHDVVYKTENGKYNAVIQQVEECHKKGQPVLVGTVSIEKSEKLSSLLKRKGIKHEVLNAKHHENCLLYTSSAAASRPPGPQRSSAAP